MTDNEFSLYLTERYHLAISWYDKKATKIHDTPKQAGNSCISLSSNDRGSL